MSRGAGSDIGGIVRVPKDVDLRKNRPLPRKTRPFSAFERSIAFRYLRGRRNRFSPSPVAGFSFVGIALGVATLVVVMSVMNGFRGELRQRILGTSGHVVLAYSTATGLDPDEATERISKVPGVRYAMPVVAGQALASGSLGDYRSLARIKGVRGSDVARIDAVASGIERGTLKNFDGSDGIAVGERMASAFGPSITLLTPDGEETPLGPMPRMSSFPVHATFSTGLQDVDSTVVYMPIETAKAFLGTRGSSDTIEVFVDDPDAAPALREEILEAAAGPFSATTWQEENESFFSALQVERAAMATILGLILIVAGLNVVSALFMLVKEKGRGIAILRTIGATRGSVVRIFVLAGTSIGTAGTASGLAIGLLACRYMAMLEPVVSRLSGASAGDAGGSVLARLPVAVDSKEIVWVAVSALVLSLAASILPALRASSLDPVEALRYE